MAQDIQRPVLEPQNRQEKPLEYLGTAPSAGLLNSTKSELIDFGDTHPHDSLPTKTLHRPSAVQKPSLAKPDALALAQAPPESNLAHGQNASQLGTYPPHLQRSILPSKAEDDASWNHLPTPTPARVGSIGDEGHREATSPDRQSSSPPNAANQGRKIRHLAEDLSLVPRHFYSSDFTKL